MPEPAGNPQLVALVGSESDRDPAAVACRFSAKINSHIEDLAGQASDELSLNEWRGLKMNPSDRSRPDAEGLVVLNECHSGGIIVEGVFAEYLHEIPALVLDLPRHDFDRTLDMQRSKFHTRSANHS